MGDVKLNSSGGGSVTLTPPSTASNYTVTLPAANATLADTSSTQTLTNKTIASLATTGTATFGGIIDTGSTGQIQFPATQNPSSNANTIDDYEEGTWTPALTGSVSNPTVSYGNQFGFYTKIGDTVTAHVNLTTNSRSGGSGSVFVSLPFPITSSNQYLAQGALEVRGVTLTSGYTYCGTLCVFGAGANVNMRQYGSNQAEIDVDMSNLSTGQITLRFTVVYKV